MAIIGTSFTVTGGETKRPPKNVGSDPSQREINILAPLGISSADQWSGQKVWLLLPGFTDPAHYYNLTLAPAIKNANPDDAILALDWTQASGSPAINSLAGIAIGDLYRSGSWITPVATAVREKLVEWGMPAAALNIVGHSLGAHLASEIAASFNTTYGSQVGSVTAHDPASNSARFVSPYDVTNGYDTDLSNGYVTVTIASLLPQGMTAATVGREMTPLMAEMALISSLVRMVMMFSLLAQGVTRSTVGREMTPLMAEMGLMTFMVRTAMII